MKRTRQWTNSETLDGGQVPASRLGRFIMAEGTGHFAFGSQQVWMLREVKEYLLFSDIKHH